jgi:cystathionine beta-lyase family protein involved in aluminum resistance
MHKIGQYLARRFPALAPAIGRALDQISADDNDTALINQARVLEAFTRHQVASHHLWGSTGYGYNDEGRARLEAIYADVFGCEAALVRPQIASGTHALWLALSGNLMPGDQVLSVTGVPYATLETVLNSRGPGSFSSLGITFQSIDLLGSGEFDFAAIDAALTDRVKLIYVQKSRGYSLRRPVSCQQIRELVNRLRARRSSPPKVVVDNCYGEFVEAEEPGHAGADLTVGSLIKNPGGGLAETGGYLAGKKELVANACDRLLAPGLEGEIGATGPYLRTMFQGLFLAPHFVGQALANARFAAALAESLGYEALPRWDEERFDLVQAIKLNSAQAMIQFCQTIQAWSPVDSFAAPIPGAIPGYAVPVVMAAGTFIQGASLELSADGPVEPPYAVYLQGGLGFEHGLIAICSAFAALREE